MGKWIQDEAGNIHPCTVKGKVEDDILWTFDTHNREWVIVKDFDVFIRVKPTEKKGVTKHG